MRLRNAVADQSDTKERILDAAEGLFAELGFARTSMRRITAEADVNLAAVNYHFGSKEGLIKAVFSRRLEPLNAERLRRLAALELAGNPTLEQLLEAFIAPNLELAGSHDVVGDRFVKLVGRSYTEHTRVLQEHVRAVNARAASAFKEAFQRVLPDLPREELTWRLHFLVGAVAYSMVGPDVARLMAGSPLSETANAQALIARLVPFLAAGMRAPLPRHR
ncbi:TetR/AcrR family transcriptional regulator [Alkalilimnicola sp. S0819]|uniref:TetR/AcrR family transcriptional regulator n=1 Tax=Alkalilimnicola sp. S0819 TaxID=2613922 RepID=UPI001869F9AE|nr:TetR/AcrR family transcriptional regulator [Alkalilimnicola sp. S0819]